MNDGISKALLCGLGLASLTKDAIQKTVEDLVKRSKITEEEGKKLIKGLQQRSKQARGALEKQVDKAVHKVFEHLDLSAIINDRLKGAKPKAAKKSRRRRGASKAATRRKTTASR